MPPEERDQLRGLFLGLTAIGVLLRVGMAIWAGNAVVTPWRIGGDARFYVLLGSNLAAGKGFAYYNGPTAFRPPLYPIFLAGTMRLFGAGALRAARMIQLGAGLATVWVCARTASRIFGASAARFAVVIALFLPSLVGLSTELMTECFATLLTAMFFDFALLNPALSKWSTAALLGLIVGVETLLRFNMAVLGLVALGALALQLDWSQAWRRMCLVTVLAGLVVAPWVVRNLVVFHGRVFLSTQGGMNAVRGVLAPQGRGQGNDAVHAVIGWVSTDLESSGPSRYITESEPDLDHRAWVAAFRLWRAQNWRLISLSFRKLGYFWLSTDQVFWTGSFSRTESVVRLAGATVQCVVLALAVVGWLRLRHEQREIAVFLLGYAALVSVVHLPFIMTSRYRVPFLDTVLVILAASAVAGRRTVTDRFSSAPTA